MVTEDKGLAGRIAAIEDHIAIEQLLYGIASGVDRYDGATLGRLIAADAKIDMGGGSVMTGAAFAAAIKPPAEPRPGRMHALSNIRIALDGDAASSECHIISWQDQLTDGVRITRVRAGRYLDTHARSANGWQLASRTLIDEWSRIDPVGEIAPQGQYLGRPAPDDLLYTALAGLRK